MPQPGDRPGRGETGPALARGRARFGLLRSSAARGNDWQQWRI